MKVVHTTLRSSFFCKISSLILGFLVWNTLQELFLQKTWISVPICFYPSSTTIATAPTNLALELEGKPSHLKKLNKDNLAIHINADALKPGTNKIKITHDLLHMPSTIQLVSAIPQTILVQVKSEAT